MQNTSLPETADLVAPFLPIAPRDEKRALYLEKSTICQILLVLFCQ